MSSNLPKDTLEDIRAEAEAFLRSDGHPAVFEDGLELFDPAIADWRLTIEFGKLLLESWQCGRSSLRRIEEVAYREATCLGLFVRKPGGRVTTVLELRAASQKAGASQKLPREVFRRELVAALERQYPGWSFERLSSRSDREHSFSGWYARGMARRGRTGWAFIGLAVEEPLAASDAALAYGLIWLDTLRGTRSDLVISELKLFLPISAIETTAHRAAWLDSRAVKVQILQWPGSPGRLEPIELKDYGNVETRLSPRRSPEAWLERHRDFLCRAFGDLLAQLDLIPAPRGPGLSIRVRGIEVARLEGQILPRLVWGLEGEERAYEEQQPGPLREFVRHVAEVRSADSREKADPLYRLQPERWLESILARDVSRLDPALSARNAYPQVPAFSGADRGVVDILSVLQDGRLAVIELKLTEDIVLPFQALDYWMRVRWLNERKQFHASGYFPGLELAQTVPRLYLVSPAFRFHSSNERIIRYLHPSIEIVKAGLNERWREGIKVLFRRRAHPRDSFAQVDRGLSPGLQQ